MLIKDGLEMWRLKDSSAHKEWTCRVQPRCNEKSVGATITYRLNDNEVFLHIDAAYISGGFSQGTFSTWLDSKEDGNESRAKIAMLVKELRRGNIDFVLSELEAEYRRGFSK